MNEERDQLEILLGRAFTAGQVENIHVVDWLNRERKKFENFRFYKAIPTESIRKREVIKLDKNFHVYLHGDSSKMEITEDDNGKCMHLRFTDAIE